MSSVQSLSCGRLSATPWTTACQASLSITNSQSLLKLRSIKSAMPFNHLILCGPLQSFPTSGSFQISQFFASGGQIIGFSPSASVLPMMHYLSSVSLETKQNNTKKNSQDISWRFLSININISIFTWSLKKGENSLKYDITWFKHTTSLHFPSYLFSCDRKL